MPTRLTTEECLRPAIRFLAMPTDATGAAGVSRIDQHDRNTGAFGLVAEKRPELPKRPIAVSCALLRPPNPYPRTNMRQVFQRNRSLRAFGLGNEPFGKNVIRIGLEAALSARQSLQVTLCRTASDLLECCTATRVPVAPRLNPSAAIAFPIAISRNVHNAEINTMKRTEVSIKLKCKRSGVRVTTTNATMSARDVAEQLGIPCSKTVSLWIRRGWLKARDAGTPPRVLWRITWEDLTAFLENPAHWIAWRPERIPDLALREWAQELRASEERLLTHTEIAKRVGVGRDTVGNWLYEGELPYVRYGNRFVPESALEGFVPPCERKAFRDPDWPAGELVLLRRVPGATFYRRAA
jgi:excisionase family DNA binding protein